MGRLYVSRIFILCYFLFLFSGFSYADEKTVMTEENKNISVVKEMFSEFAEKLDINKLDTYYSKDFVLESNGKKYT